MYAEFGERLAKLRTRMRLTQAELGMRLSPAVTRASIANIEAGKQRVYLHTVMQISVALGVPLLELLPVEDDRTEIASSIEDELRRKLPDLSDGVLAAITSASAKVGT